MVHIAIPEPTSPQFVPDSIEYNQRSLPQYLHALISSRATPIPVPLHESPQRIARILSTCHGILLPGSPADIDPRTYGQTPNGSEPPDPARAAVDEILLKHAFEHKKPILAICQGLQALNVWLEGTLIQDIPTQIGKTVDHAPGSRIAEAHPVQVASNTRLDAILTASHPQRSEGLASPLPEYVNSSHHQAIHRPGHNLRISAVSPQDQVVEAVELNAPDHFVLAVQWHPERTYNDSAFSRAIFQAFTQSAEAQA